MCGKPAQKSTFGCFKIQQFHTPVTLFAYSVKMSCASAAETKETALLWEAEYEDNTALNLET